MEERKCTTREQAIQMLADATELIAAARDFLDGQSQPLGEDVYKGQATW